MGPLVSTLELNTTENNPGMKGFCVAGLADLHSSSFCKFLLVENGLTFLLVVFLPFLTASRNCETFRQLTNPAPPVSRLLVDVISG